MPYDSNGNYTLPAIYKAKPATTIMTEQHNNPLEDIQTALNSVLLRNGSAPMTGPLNMGINKVINLADGVENTDAATVGQSLMLKGASTQEATGPIKFSGAVIVPTVTDWTKQQAVGAADADARFVNAGGDLISGTLATSGTLIAGKGGGWDRPGVQGQQRYSVGSIQFGNPADAANSPYSGQWLISDVMGYPGDDLSGPVMAASNFNAQQFFYIFAWNGNITTPKGKVAFLSDLSAYQPAGSYILSGGGTNMQDGHTIRLGWPNEATIQQTGLRAILSVDSSYFGPMALYSDVTALQAVVNGKQPAGDYATNSTLQNSLPFVDKNLRAQVFTKVVGNGVWVTIPQAFKTLVGVLALQFSSGNEGIRPLRIETNGATGGQFQMSEWSEGGNTQYTFLVFGYF